MSLYPTLPAANVTYLQFLEHEWNLKGISAKLWAKYQEQPLTSFTQKAVLWKTNSCENNHYRQYFLCFPANLPRIVSTIFYQIFIFHQMIALQKLWKMFFISSKKLSSFSRYSSFYILVFPSFSPCQPLL